jgi:diguanylate cyclase (GGDEF)-like protein/PAS domain S-box-containing protein
MARGPGSVNDGKHPLRDLEGFRALVERSDHLIARHLPNGRMFYVSPGCERLLGYRPEELVGTDPYTLLHPDDIVPMANLHEALRHTDEPLRMVVRVRRRNGSYLWCHSTMRAIRDPAKRTLLEIHSSTRDASDWREAEGTRQREEVARAAHAEHEALLRVAKAVAREDPPEQVFALVTEEAARLLAADAGRIARFEGGHAVVRGSWGEDTPPVGRRFPLAGNPVVRVFRTGEPARSDSYPQLLVKDVQSRGIVPTAYTSGIAAPIFVGSRLWGVLVTSRVGTADPFPPGAENRLARFAELVALAIASSEARAELTVRATTDSLTGLAHHRTFHERLEGEVERARRHGHPLSLVILDIDSFKGVNDRHGHQVGDAVLVEVARRLTALARAGDLVGRVGGEEFAWLLPETGADSAIAAARRACRAIRDVPFSYAGTITASVGVCAADRGDSAQALYQRADAALYAAKAQGRDRVVASPPAGAGPPSARAGVS